MSHVTVLYTLIGCAGFCLVILFGMTSELRASLKSTEKNINYYSDRIAKLEYAAKIREQYERDLKQEIVKFINK